MTLHHILAQYDCATISSGLNIMRRLLDEGASFESARAQANEYMRLRFKARPRIEGTARLLAGQPVNISDAVH